MLAAARGDANAERARAELRDLELDMLDMLVLAGPDEPDLDGQKTTVVDGLVYCLGGADGMHFHLMLFSRVDILKPKVCAAPSQPPVARVPHFPIQMVLLSTAFPHLATCRSFAHL